MSKQILILNGSPRIHGNTAALIDAFTAGAEAAGHTIARFDLAALDIHGCRGCLGGGKDPRHPCVQRNRHGRRVSGPTWPRMWWCWPRPCITGASPDN